MFVSPNLSVNEKNHLVIGKSDTVELAKQYGTPLYVIDEDFVRHNCKAYKQAVDKYYGGNGLILYASKALSCMHMYKTVQSEGLGCDVVSGGELYTAYKAGFPMDKVYFHGNNKTPDELELALKLGVSHIIVDNYNELETLNSLAEEAGKIQKIMLRIKPGVDAHTHDFIKTGQIDSKFGVALENGEAIEMAKKCLEYSNIVLDGIHCHIASQVFEIEPFCSAAEIMIDFMAEVKNTVGIELSQLNLGGGFGIKYEESDDPIAFDEYIAAVSETVKKCAADHGLKVPFILMEPGRSIVGNAGVTLYTVGNVKDIKNVRKYISIDGGMCDNPRYIMYGAVHGSVAANHASDPYDDFATVAGKCCESSDLIIENAKMQTLKAGDILAVLSTGAYNYSMASNYNRIPRPAMVAVSNGESKVIVKRETYDDIIKNDVL